MLLKSLLLIMIAYFLLIVSSIRGSRRFQNMTTLNFQFFTYTAPLFLIVYLYFRRRRDIFPLPPGPKKLPVLGNILNMPIGSEWETYHKWSKELGTILVI